MTENLLKQTITLKNRNYFEADNVEEVLVFDETSVVLSVGNPQSSKNIELMIGGNDLTILSLDSSKKTISIKGQIDAVVYSENTSKKGFFSKLFG